MAQGLQFNGSSAQMTTSFLTEDPTTFTLSLWFKTSSKSGHKMIGFEKDQTGTNSENYDRSLYVGTDGKVYFGWWIGSASTIASTKTLTDNVWHQAVATYSGTTGTLYIDGVSQGSLAATPDTGLPRLVAGRRLQIGRLAERRRRILQRRARRCPHL